MRAMENLSLTPTGEGSGRNTRGRVLTRLFAVSLALGKRVLTLLACCVAACLTSTLNAQTFTTLHSFAALTNNTNSDGASPRSGLVLSGNILYGTALSGGESGGGTVFALNTDGSGFTTLHSFTAINPHIGTNSDGGAPFAPLILSGKILYGTANSGGSWGAGTVFAINTNGADFTTLYNFGTGNNDGENPVAGLVLSGNRLYGTTSFGGSGDGVGTVFALNTDGTDFTTLHSFDANTDGSQPGGAGYQPGVGLILSGNRVYGTAQFRGSSGNGTVFAVYTDGTDFVTLHSFTATVPDLYGTNSDGARPNGGMILSGDTLYGATSVGGSSVGGTLFVVTTDGASFVTVHDFGGGGDGFDPHGLILSGSTLYGTTGGTVFAVNTDGTGFTNLYSFTQPVNGTNTDGANPGDLFLSGNTLYGTTSGGGTSGQGTVFSLSFTPQLTIVPSGTDVILTWPTNYVGFDYSSYTLQSTTNLAPSAIWTSVSPAPAIVNGRNIVTNPITGTRMFFRLSQ